MAQASRRHSAKFWTETRYGGADLCKLRRSEHRVGVHYLPYFGENGLTNSANFSCIGFSEVRMGRLKVLPARLPRRTTRLRLLPDRGGSRKEGPGNEQDRGVPP